MGDEQDEPAGVDDVALRIGQHRAVVGLDDELFLDPLNVDVVEVVGEGGVIVDDRKAGHGASMAEAARRGNGLRFVRVRRIGSSRSSHYFPLVPREGRTGVGLAGSGSKSYAAATTAWSERPSEIPMESRWTAG